jgi:hypothetical protein
MRLLPALDRPGSVAKRFKMKPRAANGRLSCCLACLRAGVDRDRVAREQCPASARHASGAVH